MYNPSIIIFAIVDEFYSNPDTLIGIIEFLI